MATPAQHPIQDFQNLNIIYHGTTLDAKTDVAKVDKRGGPGRRKPLSNISNSATPSVLHSVKKDNSINVIPNEKDLFAVKAKLSKAPGKGKVGGRKPPAGGKTDGAKADKGGGPGRRKPLSNISNSGTPSVLHSVKKDKSKNVIPIQIDSFAVKAKLSKAPEKGNVGGRKPLGELTNKPPPKQVPNMGQKLNAVVEENVSSWMMEEGFLPNHEECIKAQEEAVARQADYMLKEYFTVAAQPSTRRALPLSSKKKPENTMKHFEIDDDDDDDEMLDVMEEVLHDHEKCIKAQEEAEAVARQADDVLKEYFTDVDVADRRALSLSSKKKPENTMKHFEMNDDDDEMPDMLDYFSEDDFLQCRKSELPGKFSLTCRSPQSPPYISGM